MKRLSPISLLVFGLILLGCASAPKIVEGPSLDGTWVKEDGAYITFKGNYWESVDMINGTAGYGTFAFFSEARINFKYPYMANLRVDQHKGAYGRSPELVKEFQEKAQEEFWELYPEQIVVIVPGKTSIKREETNSSSGDVVSYWHLESDVLTFTDYMNFPPDSFYLKTFLGTYIKDKTIATSN